MPNRTKVIKPLLIPNGRLIDPGQGIDETGNLFIAEGKIGWLGQGKLPRTGYDILDAQGLIVCPGFIDFHCHLRQPGFEEKETIATGAQAAARGGFTTVCAMPNTTPPLDNPSVIDYVKSTAASDGAVRVLPIGCVSLGRQGQAPVDFTALASAGVIAFTDDGEPVANSRLMTQALEFNRLLGLPIIDHCEDRSLTEGGQMNQGALSARLGLGGIPAVAEESMVKRDLTLAEHSGGHLHIAHVSTAGSVELIRRAKKRGVRVTAEVTPHHLSLTEELVAGYNTLAKVNPPLRTREDVKALIKGLNDKVIDIIATDHAPHTRADKEVEFTEAAFGISGLETALGSLMGLVHRGEIALPVLIASLTSEVAKIIGDKYSRLGTLAAGAPADVTIFDPDKEWLVDPDSFASKGKNTPLAGTTLKGKVMATIYGGKIVYIDDKMGMVRG
ncbi:MAG: dihydroorotase [Dehalococcoidia bacterium]|nr:MAG: dihydroorotase [Dehalococcoidia bacterium]